jgi:N-acetylglucosaminyldiphosphoundecaprenol N-acetyl-beta-D-mannosaminyltransferase
MNPHPRALQIRTLRLLGSDLAVTNYQDLARKLLRHVGEGNAPLAVDFANTHVLTLRRHEADFAKLSEALDITVPDGMPLLWVMNAQGAGLEDRVYGPTFTRQFLESCPAGITHYLVGGSEECGEKFREQMMALNPTLNFIGGYHGRCSAEGILEDEEMVLQEIREKKPDFLWVGLGAPKQYAWIHRIKPQLSHGVLLAVGFALDVNAGMKADAPLWMQQNGLGWLHRMAMEPERLLGRYLKYNALFLWYLLADALGWKRVQEKGVKSCLRDLGLWFINLFASDIPDCVTGAHLGRGFLIGIGGKIFLIGYKGRPLVPKFLPQERLTYWKQGIGFTTQEAPDFPRLLAASPMAQSEKPRVLNIVLTHEGGAALERVMAWWKPLSAEENLWVAFGGTREEFDAITYPRKVFIDDPRLRTLDHQREKQCYAGIFSAMAPVVEREAPDYIYFCEYDHLPLIPDLNERQVSALRAERADVMGHWLLRVDGTGHYHELYHETDPEFTPFWASLSRRDDPTVIFSMFGSGSFWTREAFLAVAAEQQKIACYLEIYLPTLAHHLGFRIRGWKRDRHLISNLPSPEITIEQAREKECWTVHPVKKLTRGGQSFEL